MESVRNNNRILLFSTLVLLFHRPALAQRTGAKITCTSSGVTCDSSTGAVKSIDLSQQNLQGSLPDLSNLNLTALQYFSIDNNPVNWSFLRGLTASSQLVTLSANNASLTGQIPDIIGSFPSLQNLHLAYNKIQGPLPKSLAGSNITTLWLNNQNPRMSADLSVIGSMLLLQQVWLHVNSFSGPIPDLSNCADLESLYLRDNQFNGPIPASIEKLTKLRNMTLSNNDLTGSIQLDLTHLADLTALNVTNNNLLLGTITVLPNVAVDISGDSGLLIRNSPTANTPPTSASGNTNTPSSPSPTPRSGGMSAWAIAIIVIVVLIVAAAVGICICIYKKSWKKKRLEAYKRPNQLSDSDTHVSIDINDGCMDMDIDLLIQVTDNFSEAKVIGRGGFGTVYRGKLPADGREVAVKRMVAPVFMSSKGMAEYKAEIEVLSKVKHRNLVGLIGFCANGNERLLVYEFMPQGTLGDHLFDWRQRGGRPLTWSQRAAIALDVARGVEYLHTSTEQSFIHRDLKPNNILLGDDMRAKVADFGLVKNAGNAAESIQTKVAGTFGYFAPEYWETGRVTTKVDVYAFGVILMEIISGRKVVDDSEDGGNLMARFKKIIAGKEDVRGGIDPTLHADEDEETYRKICKVVELAGHCTVSEPQRRCDMRYAVYVLTSLVEQWTPSNSDVQTTFRMDPPAMQLPNLVEQWKAGNGMPSMSYTFDI